MKRSFLTLLLGIGLVACNNKTANTDKPDGVATYLNIEISLPGVLVPTRDLPEDYNPDDTYEGNDLIQTLDIYMVHDSDGHIEAKRLTTADLSTDGTVVSPSQPFRTTSGYKTIYIVLNDPNPLETTITSEDELVPITGLARGTFQDRVYYDLITMTGKSGRIYIEPDVPIQDVNTGTNRIAIEVVRVASKVIVTTTAPTTLTDEEGTTLGTLSNITYSVAQGTNQIYWIGRPDFTTWGSDFVPQLGEYDDQAETYYDYADLSTPLPVPALPTAADGYKALEGKFLFENTHTEGDVQTTGYRKGNTAYVLVRATLTPSPAVIADGGTLTNGTFYVGQSDGNIYSSKNAALTAVTNQRVATYAGGKMLYYAWLNPDDIAAPLNSPVLRNNIYHINITGFGRLGYNWNPLYPEDPDTTNPQNPDPKPGSAEEPDIPIDPIDPLTPEQTYMSVEVTVADWYVHSYDIEF